MYIYQYKDWPDFTWDQAQLYPLLAEVKLRQGRLIGRMEGLGFSLQEEAMLQTLTLEIVKSNEIENEVLDADQVRSSIARRLGIDIGGLVPADRHVEGVVEMMLDATQRYAEPLTEQRLCSWHAALFPTGYSGMYRIVTGQYRTNAPDDPMQVVSGAMGRERVHYEAPPAAAMPAEMQRLLHWCATTTIDPLLQAAVAHLWFLTIHPFDDGNGRIARAVADMLLARADGHARRFYSMSAQIRLDRQSYYDILERTQRRSPDITDWLLWFLHCLDRALRAAEQQLSTVLTKARYWDWLSTRALSERQRIMINRLLDGFDGKLTTAKWAKITKCSHDTALRDIQSLLSQGVLVREPGGSRSTSYALAPLP